MTDTTQTADSDRVTKRDLAEGKIEKVMTDRTAMVQLSEVYGGLHFENALQMADTAKLMATAGDMLPPWLQGNVGGCWGILLLADELRVSPLRLAAMTYLVENKGVRQVAFMSNYYHSIIEARAPIKGRLQVRYEGEGDARKCFVSATFKGETAPREWPPKDSGEQYTLGKLRPGLNDRGSRKGSPLWDTKPDLQMFYAISRDWARVFCPDIIAGIYARDELPDAIDVTPERQARDVTPKLRERLRGPVGEGLGPDMAADIDAALKSARVPDTKKPGGASATAGAADGASVKTAPSSAADPAGDGAVTETSKPEGASDEHGQ
jgi:hypothetical protein